MYQLPGQITNTILHFTRDNYIKQVSLVNMFMKPIFSGNILLCRVHPSFDVIIQ